MNIKTYEALNIAMRIMTFSIPFLIAFEVWQEKEIRRISDEQVQVSQWRSDIPSHMKLEAERLRLEILATVTGTVGAQLSAIQQSIVRVETRLDFMTAQKNTASK